MKVTKEFVEKNISLNNTAISKLWVQENNLDPYKVEQYRHQVKKLRPLIKLEPETIKKIEDLSNELIYKPLGINADEIIHKPIKTIQVIGDIHLPYEHKDYLEFNKKIKEEYNPDLIIFIGDILDNHAISYHESNPDLDSAGKELEKAREKCKEWAKVFPTAIITNGNHDCYDEKTEVLTEFGWIKGVDLKEGIAVATMNLKTENIEYQVPDNIILKDYNGEMIKFTTPNYIDLLVTPNHRIVFKEKERKKKGYKIKEAYKINQGYKYFPVGTINNFNDYNIVDEELKLLAWIASDGSVLKNNKFVIYQSKIKNVSLIKNILSNLNIDYKESKRDRNITHIQGKELLIKPLPSYEFYFSYIFIEEYLDKYKLPSFLNKLSKRQFDIFISSYIDGDGSVKKNKKTGEVKNGKMIYGTKEIIDQLQSLCIQYGYSATISVYRETQYRLNINKNIEKGIFLNKSVSIEEYTGKVWCVSVPNTTVVVRRNGKPSIQGNCLYNRKIQTAGLPSIVAKDLDELLDVKDWKFVREYEIDNYYFTHGTKLNEKSIIDLALRLQKNVICGHSHTASYIRNITQKFFVSHIGCGIDSNNPAFAYGKGLPKENIMSSLIIKNNQPILIKM